MHDGLVVYETESELSSTNSIRFADVREAMGKALQNEYGSRCDVEALLSPAPERSCRVELLLHGVVADHSGFYVRTKEAEKGGGGEGA